MKRAAPDAANDVAECVQRPRRRISLTGQPELAPVPNEKQQVPASSSKSPPDVISKRLSQKKTSLTISDKKKKKESEARNVFRLRFRTWSMSAGSHLTPDGKRVIWLGDRKGAAETWGVGCSLCAAFMVRMNQEAGHCRRSFSTKWARYAINGLTSMQSCTIRKHSLSSFHVAAWKAFQMPASLSVEFAADPSDVRLLAGAVPQPDDWLHAFRAFRQCTSSRGASAFNLTDQFINSSRLDVQAIQRRAFQQMHTVMHESLRQTKRQLFRQAMSCTLSVDDKKPYRLVRFKLTTVKGEVHQGMLCLLYPVKKLMDSPPEEWDRDKSQLAAENVASGVRQFCTPRDAPFDQDLYNHVLSVVRCFTSDGAAYAQKTGRCLKRQFCPNIILIFRDTCHMLRISAGDPLAIVGPCQHAWNVLFEKKKSLVPQVQHSYEWRARLTSLTRMLLQDGTLGGVLKTTLRNFGFAQQRWESSVVPQRALIASF